MKFAIDSEFSCLCPMLSDEERGLLEASILEHGCRDALVVWREERVLLDGHNRHTLCTANDVPFETVEISLPDRDAARNWIIDNALGRRNLSREQRDYLLGKRYAAQKQTGFRQSDGNGQAAERVAATAGVSPRTVERAAQYAEAVDRIGETAGPTVKRALLSGDVKLTREQVQRAADRGVKSLSQLRDVAKGRRVKQTTAEKRARTVKPAEPAVPTFDDIARSASALAARVRDARAAVESEESAASAVVPVLEALEDLRSEIDALVRACAQEVNE